MFSGRSYLLVRVVVGINVIVKLLMFVVLLVAELTVEIGLQVLQRFGDGVLLLRIVLKHSFKGGTVSSPLRLFRYDGCQLVEKSKKLYFTGNQNNKANTNQPNEKEF